RSVSVTHSHSMTTTSSASPSATPARIKYLPCCVTRSATKKAPASNKNPPARNVGSSERYVIETGSPDPWKKSDRPQARPNEMHLQIEGRRPCPATYDICPTPLMDCTPESRSEKGARENK